MLGKEKRNREVQQDVAGKMNLSKDDIFKNLIIEYASSRKDLIVRLRQKRITDAEFMAYVDDSLKKIDADTEVKDQARLMFYQYVFRYFRLTSLIEDPEISDIHCIAYNKIRIKKRGKRQAADVQFASNQEYREFIDRVATQNGVNISNLNAIQRFADDETDKNFILRFTLITPIVTTYGNPYLIIRKFPKNFPEISDLVREKFMSQQLADTLVERFRTGSTLICGGNSDGKSTLLNALKETLPEDMAVMVAQQADELTTKHHPDMIFLHSLSESAESAVKYDLEQLSIASLTMVIYVGKTYHPMAALHRTYIRIDGILHEKKVFFDYEETRRFLMSHGAADHFGPWIDPVKYLAIRICLAAIGFTVGIYVNAFVGLVGMVIGFFLLPLLLLYINNKDNDALTPQIQTLYSLLQVQIHAGVPMIDALSESYQSFPAGRLRNALSEFSTTIYFNGSFDKSLEELNGKFDNGFIDSLCIILLQARESGQAMELLRDISQQITDMQASLQLKKKEKLNRITTFCLMGIMGAMIGVALYAAITQMYASVGSF